MTSLGDRVAMARRSRVMSDVAWERVRQDEKWGTQNHPDLSPFPGWPGRPERFGQEETRQTCAFLADLWKAENDRRAEAGTLTWDGILLEEVFEALAAETVAERRDELVQVASVAVAQVEAIDRRIAEAVAVLSEPRHGDRGVCAECGGGMHFLEHSVGTGLGTYEVLDAWWAHDNHPADGHDAREVAE